MYVAPGFCPPNLLFAGAIVSEWQSCQVANEVWELDLLLGSLIDVGRGDLERWNLRSLL